MKKIYITLVLILVLTNLGAEELFRIQSKANPNEYIHVEQPQPASGGIQPGWHSAQWILEPVSGENFYRIRNYWRKTSYLHIENGGLESGQILPGWFSAQWSFEQVDGGFYRIRNRWQPNQVIHNQNGSLSSGAIFNDSGNSLWKLSSVNQPVVTEVRPQVTTASSLPVNDMRLFQPQHNGTVGMVLIRYTNQFRTMMDLQVRPGDKVYFFPQRLPDANREGITFNPDNPELGGLTFIVEEVSPKIVLDRPMPMIRNKRNDTFAFVVEVYR